MGYNRNRAAHLEMARHYDQHQHCPGFDGGRYHRGLDYRCPHCEGNTAPPVRSQWRVASKATLEQGIAQDKESRMHQRIAVELHYRRPHDGLATYASGYLCYGTLGGQTGLPVVRLTGENYRRDDGRLEGELVGPRECPPLMPARPLSPEEQPLWDAAMAQGYTASTSTDPLPLW